MGAGSDAQIHREHRPAALAIQNVNPFSVRSIAREFVSQSEDFVLINEERLQRFC